MTTSKYRLILFDCFNTLFLLEKSRVPTIEVDGKATPSTAGLLLEHFREILPGLDEAGLHRAMRKAWHWSEEKRGDNFLEIPAPERFSRLMEILGIDDPGPIAIEDLLATHMARVTGCYWLPEETRAVLQRLSATYRLAIFSNFDYAPAVPELLERERISQWFDPVVVSAAIGLRKPGRAAFDKAIEMVGESRENILFVGDSWHDDVTGACAAGIDIAWIDANGEFPEGDVRPSYTIGSLAGIEEILS